MTGFGLTASECELICGVLRQHTEVTHAKIFGSRAKDTYRPSSDIDLALWGEFSRNDVATIAEELEDLPLPYFFDVEAYDSIRHEPLRDHIDRAGKTIYARA